MFGFSRRIKLLAAIGGAVAIGAVSLGGIVLAQTGGGGSGSSSAQSGQQGQGKAMADAFLNDVANRLHVQRSDLDGAMKGAAHDQVNAAVQSGKLTQAQADQINQRIDNAQVPGFGFGRFGGGHGNDVNGKPGNGKLMADLQPCMSDAQSAAQQDRSAGKSAADTGKDVASKLQPCLDKAVANKDITAQQEQDIINNLNNGRGPFLGGGRSGMHHGKPGQSQNAPQTTQ